MWVRMVIAARFEGETVAFAGYFGWARRSRVGSRGIPHQIDYMLVHRPFAFISNLQGRPFPPLPLPPADTRDTPAARHKD